MVLTGRSGEVMAVATKGGFVTQREPQRGQLLLELMIPPQTGWVAQWQSVLHVWGSPGFDPWSGLFFLFLQLSTKHIPGWHIHWRL